MLILQAAYEILNDVLFFGNEFSEGDAVINPSGIVEDILSVEARIEVVNIDLH